MGLFGEAACLQGEGAAAHHDGFTNEHGSRFLSRLRGPLRAANTPGARDVASSSVHGRESCSRP
ncbi:Hypothetical protein CAP_4328 [Chondromyces apiculatus DSM 436]|uniref:Uncharacterized protein n=1 Tax=Chondromyces apiculatus DSM 436 TaxID=1192034 RepID=A0A017T6M6_9BACT|nr:Hypothetical protein CAP_4328 [Chondromyces apiculatus DSM 436]